MRETPNMDHLELWCAHMTFGGALTEVGPDELHEQATREAKDAERELRVARNTSIAKARKRARRFRKAATTKAREVYLLQLASRMQSASLEAVGDLSYADAHEVLALANAFGENWLRRQVAH